MAARVIPDVVCWRKAVCTSGPPGQLDEGVTSSMTRPPGQALMPAPGFSSRGPGQQNQGKPLAAREGPGAPTELSRPAAPALARRSLNHLQLGCH